MSRHRRVGVASMGVPAWYPGDILSTEADNPAEGDQAVPAGQIGALPKKGAR